MIPYYQDGNITFHLGDCLDVLQQLPDKNFDAVITDPPYSSGGMTLSVKSAPTSKKYCTHGKEIPFPDFAHDSKDQRGLAYWARLWLTQAQRLSSGSEIRQAA